jgi:hypothetical protein
VGMAVRVARLSVEMIHGRASGRHESSQPCTACRRGFGLGQRERGRSLSVSHPLRWCLLASRLQGPARPDEREERLPPVPLRVIPLRAADSPIDQCAFVRVGHSPRNLCASSLVLVRRLAVRWGERAGLCELNNSKQRSALELLGQSCHIAVAHVASSVPSPVHLAGSLPRLALPFVASAWARGVVSSVRIELARRCADRGRGAQVSESPTVHRLSTARSAMTSGPRPPEQLPALMGGPREGFDSACRTERPSAFAPSRKPGHGVTLPRAGMWRSVARSFASRSHLSLVLEL